MEKKKAYIVTVGAFLLLTTILLVAFGANMQQANVHVQGTVPEASFSAQAAVPVGLTLYKTYTGKYNYVATGMGVRNTGRGTISLVLPKGTTLTNAFLYWTIFDNTTPNANDNKIVVNGILVTGTLIGTGPSTNWAPPRGYAYRAYVTDALSQTEGRYGISYGLEIGGMSSKVVNGTSPWVNDAAPEAESVHLIMVYSDPSLSSSTVQIYNGYSAIAGGSGAFNYAWPARTGGTTRFTHLMIDNQIKGITPYSKSVAFTFGPTTTTIDDKDALNGKDPSITSKATYQGSLSDTNTYDVGSLVANAGGASTITWNLSNDYIAVVGLAFASGVD